MATIAQLKQMEDDKLVLADLSKQLGERFTAEVNSKEAQALVEFKSYFSELGFTINIATKEITAIYGLSFP